MIHGVWEYAEVFDEEILSLSDVILRTTHHKDLQVCQSWGHHNLQKSVVFFVLEEACTDLSSRLSKSLTNANQTKLNSNPLHKMLW